MSDDETRSIGTSRLPAGTTVELLLLGERRKAVIVADRGYVGPSGARVLRIRVELAGGPIELDITWDNVESFQLPDAE